MIPHLTARGVALLILGVGASAGGALLQAPWAGWTGHAVLAFLAIHYALAVARIGELERGQLRAGISAPASAPYGTPTRATLLLRNGARVGHGWVTCEVESSAGVAVPGTAVVGALGPASEVEVPVALHPRRLGRAVVRGVRLTLLDPFGLVATSAYVPIDQELWVRAPVSRGGRVQVASDDAQAGARTSRVAGSGVELRELRDYAPGDATRHVDWKATARRRVLTVREREAENVGALAVALDASSSMRGALGGRFADTQTYAHALVAGAASAGDRFAVLVFDDAVVSQLALGRGAAHEQRAHDHIDAAERATSARNPGVSESDATWAVVRYLRVHEGLEFGRRGQGSDEFAPLHERVDLDALHAWLRRRLDAEAAALEARSRGANVPLPPTPVRRFALLRGISLDPVPESRLARKDDAIVAALERATRAARGGVEVAVLTDLTGVHDMSAVVRAVRLARAGRARVRFVVPYEPAFVGPVTLRAASEAAHTLLEQAFARDLEVKLDALRRAGAGVERLGPLRRSETPSGG